MKFIIEATDEGQVTAFNVEDGKCSLDELIAILFEVMDAATRKVLENAPKEVSDFTYEHFNGIFDLFLRKVFPDPPEGYFELSDAALVYAQDRIIDDAEKKGLTFEEALKKFEDEAKAYLNKRREGLA